MTVIARHTLLFGFLLVALACSRVDRPTAPSPVPVRYQFHGPVSYAVSDYTARSSYVLDRGTFTLRYPSLGRDYVGTYRQDGNRINFVFASDGRWDAVGTLDGDSLEVRYNVIMELSDFDNAVYRRVQ